MPKNLNFLGFDPVLISANRMELIGLLEKDGILHGWKTVASARLEGPGPKFGNKKLGEEVVVTISVAVGIRSRSRPGLGDPASRIFRWTSRKSYDVG